MGRGGADYSTDEALVAKHLFEMLLLAFGRRAKSYDQKLWMTTR